MADDEEDIPVITKIKIDATLKRLEREVQEIADVVVPPTPSQPYPQSTRWVASQSLTLTHRAQYSPFTLLLSDHPAGCFHC